MPTALTVCMARRIAGELQKLAVLSQARTHLGDVCKTVIAAEMLPLGDVGNPRERSELRYLFTVSLRADVSLEDAGTARRMLFRFTRNGYDARIATVHGREPDSALLEDIDGAQFSLLQYADAMEEVLRRALCNAVQGAQDGSGPLVDWDELSWTLARLTPPTILFAVALRTPRTS